MKFGYRKPSFKKSFKARTTGKWKRSIKGGQGYLSSSFFIIYTKMKAP